MNSARLNRYFFAKHLDDDEEIIEIVHKHWLLGIKFLFWPTITFLFCWVVLYFVPFLGMFYFVSLLATICLVWFLRNFFDYYLDAWIITDQGIIDVEWHGWFHRESTRVLYSDIQGVSHEVQGVLPTVLSLGEVTVEKISTGSSISIDFVKKPIRIEKMILKQMESYLHSKNLHDSTHVQDILSAIVAREMKLQEEFEGDDDSDDEWDDDDDEWEDDDDEWEEDDDDEEEWEDEEEDDEWDDDDDDDTKK